MERRYLLNPLQASIVTEGNKQIFLLSTAEGKQKRIKKIPQRFLPSREDGYLIF